MCRHSNKSSQYSSENEKRRKKEYIVIQSTYGILLKKT